MCIYKPAELMELVLKRSGCFCMWFSILLIFNHALTAQKNFKIKVFIDGIHDEKAFAKVTDPDELNIMTSQWIDEQRKEGYLLAGMDSFSVDTAEYNIHLHKGTQFHYVMMMEDSNTLSALQTLPLILSEDKNSSPEYWSSVFNSWIRMSADRGYPFARVDVAAVVIHGDSLIARYKFIKGSQTVFHQTDQRQKKILDDKVLNRMIGIIPGDLYNQTLVEGIQDKIGKLSYVQMRSSPRVLFLGNEGIVWLYLEKSRASKFDILLGLNPESGLTGKKYSLTGEAGFEILNSLKSGEKIFLKYEKLIENSPKLKLGVDFPYVKFIPFGLAADFHLYRFGEQYIDLSSQWILSYPWSLLQLTGLSLTYLTSTLLNPDSLTLLRTRRLPSQLDYTYLAAGLRHEFNNVDYKPNPSRGWSVLIDVKAGTKTFKENTILLSYESDQVHVQQQYDSLNQNNEQAVYAVQASKYFNLKTRHVLKIALSANGLLTSGKILDNELIRVGGYKSLRGFDEDFYKCTHAMIQTVEYRFLLDRNSFLNVFSDFAYLKQAGEQNYEWNWYEGFGLGIQFQTKVGAFSLQYAMGASKLQSVDFGKGKIHFGYSTLF